MVDPHYSDEILSLAREFRAGPFGQHSPNLQKLLREFRSEPIKGKYALLSLHAHRKWMLVELTGDETMPIIRHHDTIFSNLADAEWHVFRLRLEKRTGAELFLDEE